MDKEIDMKNAIETDIASRKKTIAGIKTTLEFTKSAKVKKQLEALLITLATLNANHTNTVR
jgi:hypothetical protein